MIRWNEMKFGGDFPLLEPGMYKVTINSLERGVSPQKNTPRIEVKATTENGESLVDFLSLSDAAMWRIGQALTACGMTEEDVKKLPDCDANGEEFMRIMLMIKGRDCMWDVTQETYNGKTRNKVANWVYDIDTAQAPLVYEETVPEWVKAKTKASGLKK